MRYHSFQEIMTTYPTLYVGTKAEEDTELQSLIYDWYQLREVGDTDERFRVFFRRSINRGYDKFKLLAQLELSELPELADFAEHVSRQLKANVSLTEAVNNVVSFVGEDTGSRQGTAETTVDEDTTLRRTGTDTDTVQTNNTVTQTGTDTVEVTNTGTDALASTGTTKLDRTGTVTNAQTQDAKHVEIGRGLPQSNSYSGAAAGSIPSLDWSTATNQYQSSDNSGTQQQTNDLEDLTTINTTDTRTLNTSTDSVDTKNLTNTASGSTSDTLTHNTTDTGTNDSTTNSSTTESSSVTTENTTTTEGNKRTSNEDHRAETTDRVVQRELETELKAKVWDYIAGSDAFKYFCRVWLDECFFGLYEV